MSKTSKQIGAPEGYAKKDPGSFSNPKQGDRLEAGRQAQVDPRHRTPSTTERVHTSGGDTADGNVRQAGQPTVKILGPSHKVTRQPRTVYEEHGK